MKKLFYLFLPLALFACTEKTVEIPAYTVNKEEIVIPNDAPFLKRLELVSVKPAQQKESSFHSVGQLVALSNTSGELTGNTVAWTELDPELSHKLGLKLQNGEKASLGVALGLTLVPTEYTKQMQIGQSVDIARYGLKKSAVRGTIWQIRAAKGEMDTSSVIFRINHGEDWYPGTNCEVSFPLLKTKTVGLPTTAILHEGLREFVFKETTTNHFKAIPISIVEETPDSAFVVGLSTGDRVVAAGAILLKPELHHFIHERKGAYVHP